MNDRDRHSACPFFMECAARKGHEWIIIAKYGGALERVWAG
jgi:hypothetical protein